MTDIAQKIRKLRIMREYTQEHLATCLKISIRSYRNLESGKCSPTFDQLTAFAQVMQCSLDTFLCFNPASCRFEPEQSTLVREFSTRFLSVVLNDREISDTAKTRVQQLLRQLSAAGQS